MEKVKVRIAPSPTGYLHIGTARTALFNWLFAERYKKLGYDSKLILRIEDTDLERSDKKYEEDIIKGLEWLGLKWDGEIFYQSKRLDIYKKYLKKLLESEDKKAFWCYHTKEELEAEQKEQMAKHEAPRHICDHKDKQIKGRGGVIRLNVGLITHTLGDKIDFYDLVRNTISWDGVEGIFGDFVIAKNENSPLYNFAAVVDDIEMKITHVIRGEDHISNTPKQILIYEALGKEPPKFAHLPLILAPDRSKLSKRHGATSVTDFKKDYLPEALVNFIGFLGYTYGKDIISKEEMAEEFELEKVHKSGAIFDTKKLNWINSQYIKNLSSDEFKKISGLTSVPDAAIPLIIDRLEKLSDIAQFEYLWEGPEYDKELLKWKKFSLEDSKKSLEKVKDIIASYDFKDKNKLRKSLDELALEVGDRGLVYWPLRVALTGKEKSPDPVDIAFILDKKEVLGRLDEAKKKLE